MDRKWLCAAMAAAVLTCLAACAAPSAPTQTAAPSVPQASAASAAGMEQAAAPAETESASAGGTIFDGVLAALPESGVMSVTDRSGTTFQVDASDENVRRMWDILLSEPFAKLEATDDLFQGAYDSIALSFSRDKDKYLIKLYGCADSHPVYPGRTLIDLESHGSGESSFQSFIGGTAVFQQIANLAERLRGTLRVVLSEPFVKLEAGALGDETLTAWLEMGNRMMCAFTGADGNSRIMTFDTQTGALLGTARVAEPVRRMEPARGESGFDYQAFTDSRVLYRNSRNPLEEKPYSLPEQVKPVAWKESKGDFDRKGELLLWAGNDGIHLAAPDGSNERMLLSNSDLAGLAGALAPDGELRAVAPRLLNGGQQAVIPVCAADQLAGVVLIQLETEEKTAYFDVFGESWQFLAYPDKRTFAAAGEQDVTVVSVTAGESKRLPFEYQDGACWYSGDYSTFLVAEPKDETLFQSYLVSARKPQDRSRPFLTVEGRGTFAIAGVSERHILAYVDDDEGPRYLLVKM